MRVIAIALNTAREALRNKVLYSIVLFACLVAATAGLFGSVSIGEPMKFVKDFSLMSIGLFGVVIATMLGATMLQKELGRRTILNILSKPVARWEFIAGKFLGLFATVAITVGLMCCALLVIVAVVDRRLDLGLAVASGLSLFEMMIVVSVALLVSSIVVTPTMVGLVTAAVFIAGRAVGYLSYFVTPEQPAMLRAIARMLYWLLPHLDRFNIANRVVYGDLVSVGYVAAAILYAAAYTGIVLLLSVAFFSRREFA